jgi:3',5'-cyclic-AMP phosphodiesterase
MPIHLPPISRRKFLIRSVVAGSGLVLSHKIFAADKSIDEDFWALFSDTHIAADRAKIVRDVNMADHLAAVTRELIALPQRAAGVFVIGDCAWDSGEKDDYVTFTNLLEPIRRAQMPVHLALGNHDNRERFWDSLEEEMAAKRPLADRQAALLPTPRVNWFILDSLEKTLVTTGLIGVEQLDWLAKSLDANSNKAAVILVHHNLDAGEKSVGLRDTEELFKVLRPRKQVKACVFGHTHNWNVARDESGIHLINLPPVAYLFREGRPSGWVRATLEPDGMRMELRCVDPAHKDHGQILNLKWREA